MSTTQRNESRHRVSALTEISAIPVVADSAARDVLIPDAEGDERVYNKATRQLERYDASVAAWVPDVVGAITPQLLGARGNAKKVFDGAMTSGQATLTSATANFTAADVGKLVVVQGAGVAGAALAATISGFTNSANVVLSATAGGTVSGKVVCYGTDDSAAVTAYLTALSLTKGLGSVPAGSYAISANHSVPLGVSLQGAGGALSSVTGSAQTAVNAATTFQCMAAGAGFTVAANGGRISHFSVDGNLIATAPLTLGLMAGRLFEQVFVEFSAQDNWTINKAQNCVFLKCESQFATRDNLLLDLGCGGLLFDQFESNAPGRHTLKTDQSGASPEVYAIPTHIQFLHPIFERGSTDNLLINITKGDKIYFTSPVVASTFATPTTALVGMSGTGNYYFTNPVLTSTNAIPVGFTVASGSTLYLHGGSSTSSVTALFEGTGGQIRVYGGPLIGGSYKTAGTSDSVINTPAPSEILSTRPLTSSTVLSTAVTGEAGQRFRIRADGLLQFGDGTGFTFNDTIAHTSAGLLTASTTWAAKRFKATGTALVAGDFALSAGWGTTASVGSVIGTDQAWQILVTSSGTGQALNPTITLTYHDGTFTLGPITVSKMSGGSGTITQLSEVPTSTTLTITFLGTPVAASTYQITCIALGR